MTYPEKMQSPSRTLDAIKLLNDWNKWLVTVQTAALGVLGFLSRSGDTKALTSITGKFAIAAGTASMILFCFSIAFASYLLLYLPYLAETLPESQTGNDNRSSLSYTVVPFSPGWQVGTFTTWQSRLFVLGIAFLGLTFVLLVHA